MGVLFRGLLRELFGELVECILEESHTLHAAGVRDHMERQAEIEVLSVTSHHIFPGLQEKKKGKYSKVKSKLKGKYATLKHVANERLQARMEDPQLPAAEGEPSPG